MRKGGRAFPAEVNNSKNDDDDDDDDDSDNKNLLKHLPRPGRLQHRHGKHGKDNSGEVWRSYYLGNHIKICIWSLS